MGKNERRAYLEQIRLRYRRAGRAQKTRILDEFCAVCGYHRKYAVQLLAPRSAGRPAKPARGPRPRYRDAAILAVVRRIWLRADQPCGKRLKAVLGLWMAHDEREHGKYSDDLRARLERVSAATLDRILRPSRLAHPKGRCGTKPGSLLRHQIPIRTEWTEGRVGFVEADTVAHCGTSLAGNFVWSLTMTDIVSTWTECRAVWNKGSVEVVAAIKDIESVLPFALLGFDSDNGSEFLNYHLVRYFQNHDKKPAFTRSRPYKKNDNAHVEQKNYSHVRQLLGYDRFEDPRLVTLINDLYANEFSLMQNFFSPTMKLAFKKRVGSKIVKRYDAPRTPCARLLDSDQIGEETKALLRRRLASLNPFDLRRRIEAKLKGIFRLVSVSPNVRQRI